MFTWTVDVEGDWGGRTHSSEGTDYGLPVILDVFRKNFIKGLFFLSTMHTRVKPHLIERLQEEGHEVGSHGHFHVRWNDYWRAEEDRHISTLYLGKDVSYRAPWFSHEIDDPYSIRDGHVSMLKQAWWKSPLPNEPIFYIHPFDIVKPSTKAPSLFCKLLYSRPDKVLETFKHYCRLYPGERT